MHHVMMIVPVNSDVNKTQNVAEKNGKQSFQTAQ
jgi:hypothetical protein